MPLHVSKAIRDRIGDEATFGLIDMFESANTMWS